MMSIRPMRVRVRQRLVDMLMGVRSLDGSFTHVRVGVVLVVSMSMRVDDRLVRVRMLVTLARKEPRRNEHQRQGAIRHDGRRLAEDE